MINVNFVVGVDVAFRTLASAGIAELIGINRATTVAICRRGILWSRYPPPYVHKLYKLCVYVHTYPPPYGHACTSCVDV